LRIGGPAQPSPLLGDALYAGYRYLEVKCAGCILSTKNRIASGPWKLMERMRKFLVR
jgi:hypothetical protein